jgi:ligand-binding sensor domain-containing protein
MRIYYHLLILSFFYLSTSAQTPYHWKLTDDDGLPDMEIYGLYQDSKGYMWIATDGGLCRYDGKDITTYAHPLQKRTSSASIQEDSKGNIWYKNFVGQLFFIDTNNQVQLFQLPDSIKLSTYFEYSLTKTHLNITTYSYLYHYQFNNKQWTIDTIVNSKNNNCLRGALAFHQSNDSVLIYIDCIHQVWKKKQQQLYPKGLIPPIMQNGAAIIGLENDSVLLSSRNGIYIDHINHIHQLKEDALVFNQGEISKIYKNKDQLLISARQSIFFLQKNKRTNSWDKKDHFLLNEQISALYIDRDGNSWLGTLGNGVLIIPSSKMHYFASQNSNLPNSSISTLTKNSKEDLFIGMKGSLTKLNTQSLEFTTYPSGSAYPIITILPDEKRNQILFNSGKNYSLSLSDKETKTCCTNLGHHAILYKKDQLISGNFLLLSTSSLIGRPGLLVPPAYVFDNKIKHFLNQEKKDCPQGFYQGLIACERVTALWADIVDTSRFWAGVNDSLFYWQNATSYPVSSKEGSPIIPVDIVQTEDSIIWVATSNQGLYGIKNEQEVYHFTTADGLPSNNCKTLAANYPYVWIGTNKGIVKLHPASQKMNLYNQLDGLLTNNIDHIEIANQKVWAATTKGLISFDLNTPSINSTPPLISITKWEVNDSSYALNISRVFPHDQNNIKFTFQALALKSRNTYTYEYRLLGIDSLWIQQSSNTNFVRLPNLNSGEYTFEVRARNEDGILSKQSPKISFYIQPPYWKAWWFSSIIGLTILAFIIFIIRLRYQSLQNKQATKNLITQLKMQALQAQMNPHFIFNAMSTIQSFWMYKDAKTALIYHAKFAKLMRLIFNYSDEKSIPIKEEIDFLKLYIDLEKIRLKYAINTAFEIDPIFEEEGLYIPPLLIQPIVENSFKHGFLHKEADGQLLIKLQKEGSYIKCVIEDDGVGRASAESYNTWQDNATNKKSSSFVTQDRLNMLNQAEGKSPKKVTYKITDLKDAQNNSLGTRTELWIPIIDNFFVNFN